MKAQREPWKARGAGSKKTPRDIPPEDRCPEDQKLPSLLSEDAWEEEEEAPPLPLPRRMKGVDLKEGPPMTWYPTPPEYVRRGRRG